MENTGTAIPEKNNGQKMYRNGKTVMPAARMLSVAVLLGPVLLYHRYERGNQMFKKIQDSFVPIYDRTCSERMDNQETVITGISIRDSGPDAWGYSVKIPAGFQYRVDNGDLRTNTQPKPIFCGLSVGQKILVVPSAENDQEKCILYIGVEDCP